MSRAVFAVLCFAVGALGHGRVMDPLNRGSMWRKDPTAPTNYDDNANFCGGFQIQWGINNGKCGVCGDDLRMGRPRPNENTGTYGRGKVSKVYKSGDVIPVTVEITANHFGYFTFGLCQLRDAKFPETEECFEDLRLENGNATYAVDTSRVGFYLVKLKLPADTTCTRCVLRWQYTAGNNWGICPDGSGKVGCGPQETFRTCSDISIVGGGSSNIRMRARPRLQGLMRGINY